MLIINSPGGSVTASFAIYDTMRYIKCDVNTIVVGEAHGIAAFIAISGAKGKRSATENSILGLVPFRGVHFLTVYKFFCFFTKPLNCIKYQNHGC